MAESHRGLRSLLSYTWIYEWSQRLLGADSFRQMVAERFVPRPTMPPQRPLKILDIGCGGAEILAHLGQVDYYGLDHNPNYIATAQTRYGSRGRFECRSFDETTAVESGPFDCILALGVLHHLDDSACRHLFDLAKQALAPEGQLFTADPCYVPQQSALARWIISKDRGQNVRSPEGYFALTEERFRRSYCEVRYDLTRIPYTHVLFLLKP